MRLCTKCNRLLKNSDTYCPYCAGERTEQDDRATAAVAAAAPPVEDQAITLEIPLAETVSPKKESSPVPKAAPPSRPLEEPVQEAPPKEQPVAVPRRNRLMDEAEQETVQPQPAPPAKASRRNRLMEEDVAPPHESDADTQPDNWDDGFSSSYDEDDARGAIEREMENLEEQPERAGLGKLGITLIALLVMATLFFGYSIYRKITDQSPVSQESFVALIEGRWVSERFTLNDNGTQNYVELLTLRADGTFTIQYLIYNRDMPDGYKEGDWEVFEEINGTYVVYPQYNVIALTYTENGKEIVFTREVVSIDNKTLVLREYYNTERTDYFDVKFTLVTD